jgi:hypothetical protein
MKRNIIETEAQAWLAKDIQQLKTCRKIAVLVQARSKTAYSNGKTPTKWSGGRGRVQKIRKMMIFSISYFF